MINLFDTFNNHPFLYVAAAGLCYGAISIQSIVRKARADKNWTTAIGTANMLDVLKRCENTLDGAIEVSVVNGAEDILIHANSEELDLDCVQRISKAVAQQPYGTTSLVDVRKDSLSIRIVRKATFTCLED